MTLANSIHARTLSRARCDVKDVVAQAFLPVEIGRRPFSHRRQERLRHLNTARALR